jgi:non-heme chloroperoxidase
VPYVQNRLHYSDEGAGSPVVLVGRGWEEQSRALCVAGHRVIGFDRRSQHPGGYDVDALAADLAALLEHLDLTGCVLAGSGAASGDVVRYLGTFGSGRVRKVALVAVPAPYLLRTGDNPEGLDEAGFTAVGDDALRAAGRTDLRADLARIDVPVLLLHGDADAQLPIDATAHRLPDLIADLRYEVIPDGPHELGRAVPELVNRYLLEFAAS